MSHRLGRGSLSSLLLVFLVSAGCDDASVRPPTTKKSPPLASQPEEGKKVKVSENVYLEVLPTTRRVLLHAEVCLREGPLEQLLTRKNTKELEAILAADVDARKVHEALLLANAKPGTPVRWVPKYRPPTGTTIKVTLVYEADGKTVSVPARSWIRNHKTKKELDSDWVLAGSVLMENPLDKNGPKLYLANDGDLICVANFETALLDLPIQSSKDDEDRSYDAWTERIPPLGTKVKVLLEPVLSKKE